VSATVCYNDGKRPEGRLAAITLLQPTEILYGASAVRAVGNLDIYGDRTSLSTSLMPENVNWMGENVVVVLNVGYSQVRSPSCPYYYCFPRTLITVSEPSVIEYGSSKVAPACTLNIAESRTSLSSVITPTRVSWMEKTSLAGLVEYGSTVYGILPFAIKSASFTYGDKFDTSVVAVPPPFGLTPPPPPPPPRPTPSGGDENSPSGTLALRGPRAKLTLGPSAECELQFTEGATPSITSTCPFNAPTSRARELQEEQATKVSMFEDDTVRMELAKMMRTVIHNEMVAAKETIARLEAKLERVTQELNELRGM